MPALERKGAVRSSLDADAGLGRRDFLNGGEERLPLASPLRPAVKLTGLATGAAVHMNSNDFHELLLMSDLWCIS
jgi:hypothetical protein